MALESLPKISPANFFPDNDLIQVYSKKGDYVGVINPSYIKGSPSGVSGAIQFSDGSAFASDATQLFWDNTNKRLGVGTNAPNNTTEIQIPSTYGAIGSNANLYLTSALTSAGIKIGASGSGAGCTIQATQSGGGTAFNLALNPFGGSVNIGNSNLGASLGIKGSGSTYATTSLLVQNSGGTTLLRQTDDGNLRLYTGTFSPYVYTSDGGFTIASASNFVLSHNGGINSVFFSSYYYTGDIYARYAVAIGNISVGFINASAQLQVDSTTKGFLPPRMTDAQVRAIASPAVGLMAYNTDLDCPVFYSAAGWRKVSHSVM